MNKIGLINGNLTSKNLLLCDDQEFCYECIEIGGIG